MLPNVLLPKVFPLSKDEQPRATSGRRIFTVLHFAKFHEPEIWKRRWQYVAEKYLRFTYFKFILLIHKFRIFITKAKNTVLLISIGITSLFRFDSRFSHRWCTLEGCSSTGAELPIVSGH